MRILWLLSATVTVLIVTVRTEAALIVFGDSLSNAGNTSIATLGLIPDGADGYVDGAFTNGPIWLHEFALQLGEASPQPSLAGGTNFAYGGAEVLRSDPFQPSLADQVASYLNQVEAPNAIRPDDLHIFWGGANDLLGQPTTSTAVQVATLIREEVDDLYVRGARRFLVMNVPALDKLPIVASTGMDATQLNQATRDFNVALSEQLASVQSSRPDIDLFQFDVYGTLEEVFTDPTRFGFSNVMDAAAPFATDGLLPGLATSPPADGVDVDSYLFYDGFHPTATTHKLLGSRAAAQIPEPTSLQLLCLALLIVVRRRHRRP